MSERENIIDKGEGYDYTIKLAFKIMNNEVEYEALFFGLTITERHLWTRKKLIHLEY